SFSFFFFQAEDGIRDRNVTGVQTCALPISNLFLMLETGLGDHTLRRELFDYGTATDLVPALVTLFTRTVDHALGRGVLRSYVPRSEERRVGRECSCGGARVDWRNEGGERE